MTKKYNTHNLALAIYLAFEGCRISKLLQVKRGGKSCLKFIIVNDDPEKDIVKIAKHFRKHVEPFIPNQKGKKVYVGSGDVNFERSLMTAIFGRVD